MRVVVRFEGTCREDMLAWLGRLPGTADDRRALVRAAWDALKQELVRSAGQPAGAEFHATPPPPGYWWHYAAGCWVRFTVTDSGGLVRGRVRTITVIGLEPAPPS